MFWNYFLFEAKLLLHNRKNWLLGIVLLLFFPVFIYYTNQVPQDSLRDVKREEQEKIQSILEMYGGELQDGTTAQQEVYENLIQQSSLVNFQVFYIREGDVTADYLENGFALTDLRLQLRRLETQGIASHLILSEEEILKEDALLQFLHNNPTDLDSNLFLADNQFVLAFSLLSGLVFVFYLLLNANDIVLFEQRHETVMGGFPISFMKKMTVKIILRVMQTMLFLLSGIALGIFTITTIAGKKALNSPVLIYVHGQYQGVTLYYYIGLALLFMLVLMFIVYYLSILLNLVFNNAYTNLVVGISIFLLPNLLFVMRINSFSSPLKYSEFTNVLSGDLAVQLGNTNVDWPYALGGLVVLGIVLHLILYVRSKLAFRRGPSAEI